MPINISKQFSPRRGAVATMTGSKKNLVLAAGELFIEYPNTGVGTGAVKIKIGDGTTTYENLPYAIANDASSDIIVYTDDTSSTVAGALTDAASGNTAAEIVAGLKQAITLVNAAAIYSMTVDGNVITVTDNAVSFDSPDYALAVSSATSGVTVTLDAETGYGKTDSSFDIIGSGINVSQSGSNISIAHPVSGVTSGSYLNATVDANGHVTSGTTVTSGHALISDSNGLAAASSVTSTELSYLSGTTASLQTQIDGKANSSHTHGNADITSLDASKINSGTIDIDRLPKGALERLVVVADDTARFALTTADVQKGDVVKVIATNKMYFVVDDTKLSTEAGYEEFAAGTATSVPWSGVTGKPETYPPSTHSHTMSQISDLYGAFTGATSATSGTIGFVPAPAQGDQNKYLSGSGSWTAFTNATTAVAGLMSAEDKQAVELLKAGIFDFGDETVSS